MYEYKIFSDRKLIYIKRAGEPKSAEFIESYHAIKDDQQYRSEYDGLMDIRDIIVDENTVYKRAQTFYLSKHFLEITGTTGKWATLATKPVAQALAKVFVESLADMPDGMSIEMFSSVNEVESYLGIELSEIVE